MSPEQILELQKAKQIIDKLYIEGAHGQNTYTGSELQNLSTRIGNIAYLYQTRFQNK